MKFLKFLFCLLVILNYTSCIKHTDPPPPCGTPYICLKIVDISSAGTCCKNSLKTVLRNESPSNNIYAVILEDTLLGNNWIFNKTYLKKIPKKSDLEIGCGYRTKIVSGDPVCYRYKRWRIGEACFEGQGNCEIELPDNTDLQVINCKKDCNLCNNFKFSQLSNTQQASILQLYKDLLNSENITQIFTQDIITAFFPTGPTTGDRKTILTKGDLQSTGGSYHLQPLLPSPVPFLNTTDKFQKLWIDCPNVISGSINRSPNEVDVTFTTSRPEFVTIQVELNPSKTIRTDIVKHLYLIKNEHRLVLSGDFICFNITEINLDTLKKVNKKDTKQY